MAAWGWTLLAVLLVVSGSGAYDEDDDDTVWSATRQCTVTAAGSPKYFLYMTSMWTGRSVAFKRFPKPGKDTRWYVTRVRSNGKSFFQFKNADRGGYMGPDGAKVTGNFNKYEDSQSTNTLWSIDPPRQNVPVTIKDFSQRTLNEPQRSNKNKVRLDFDKKSKWVIKCD